MTIQPKRYLHLADPLTELTRKERRTLLVVALVDIAVIKVGLVPTKIAALGIEFDKAGQQSLLTILALVTIYFLVAYVLYAISDFITWRRAILEETLAAYSLDAPGVPEPKEEIFSGPLGERSEAIWISRMNAYTRSFFLARPVSFARALFDFALPVLVGGYATYLLLRA